jgi:hypothetical protein
MTKTTTGSNRLTIIFSWVITLALAGVLAAYFLLQPAVSPQNAEALRNSARKQPLQRSEKIKQEQAQRPLPADYSRQLVTQAEILAKKDLEDKLFKFREMVLKMRQRKDNLLERVEQRRLPVSAPADANDVSQARNISQADLSSLSRNASIEDIYNRLRAYEDEIQKNHLAVNAARQALLKGLSFPEVYNSMKSGLSRMLDFERLIADQTGGGDWLRSSGSNAAAGLYIRSTADLNNYRGLLGQASRQAGLAGARLEGLFGLPRPGQAGNAGQGNGSPGGGGGGWGGGNGGLAGANMGGSGSLHWSYYSGAKLNESMVRAQAMPGRRFARNADSKGWLYINTWYMIGPWENYGRDDFSIIHPPEISIDFDAVYTDGQRGKGIEETESHPISVHGHEVWLDGTLRWHFMQSESMHNTVPVLTDHSTYYAYTELYFDEETTMLVAIGTDDSGKVWINDKDIWQDNGSSWYHIDEHIAPFNFRQGWNRVLLRLENGGGGPAGFSFLIIPQ